VGRDGYQFHIGRKKKKFSIIYVRVLIRADQSSVILLAGVKGEKQRKSAGIDN
jgi:hypothetical protein